MMKKNCIVIVTGSHKTKCGFDDNSHSGFKGLEKNIDKPITFPTILGKEKVYEVPIGILMNNRMGFGTPVPEGWAGDEAVARGGILRMYFPIPILENIPINMKYLDSILVQCVKRELRNYHGDDQKTRIIISDLPIMRDSYYKPICDSFIEEYSHLYCDEFSFLSSSFLSFYQSDLKTACVVDIGHSRSSCTSFDNYSYVRNSECFCRLGGVHISQNLLFLLSRNGWLEEKSKISFKDLNKSQKDELLTSLKHKCCFVKQHDTVDDDHDATSVVKFENVVEFDNDGNPKTEIFECSNYELSQSTEILFTPKKFIDINEEKEQLLREKGFLEIEGIHDMVTRSILRSPYSLRKELLRNILVFGGTSKIRGLCGRLRNLLELRFPRYEINIIHDPDTCEIMDYLGGCKYSKEHSEEKTFISRKEYEELGVQIVREKCKNVSFIPKEKSVIWTPNNHQHHDEEFKKVVFFLMCSSELRKNCLLFLIPKEVLMIIFTFLNRSEITEKKLNEIISFNFNFENDKLSDGLLFHKRC